MEGRAFPAASIEVNAGEESVAVPYERGMVESAHGMQEPSGAFDAAVREHYGDDA